MEQKKQDYSFLKNICDTCEGRTCIICCSVEDSSECETIACPKCNGKGFRWNTIRVSVLGVTVFMLIGGMLSIVLK